jgi:ribosomal protein S18 acetylase RimI-like enzyme
MIFQHGSYELDDDPERVDVDAAWAFLSTSAYWASWRQRDDFERQLASAWRVVGAFDQSNGAMVGFARGISDGVALAYLADVYVLPEFLVRGLDKALVSTMIERGRAPDSGGCSIPLMLTGLRNVRLWPDRRHADAPSSK